MKQFSIFETSIIGFLIGVLSSTYTLFLSSNDAYIGNILSYVSLMPLFTLLKIPESISFISQFIFYIVVFTVYGAIIGILIKYTNKPKLISIAIVLTITAGIFEQIYVSPIIPNMSIEIPYQVANITKSISIEKQYFGMEAKGDLNKDNKDDIAFLIHRKDKDRGILYYLTSAIETKDGKAGTNLIFLGEKIEPKSISIVDQIISIDYSTGSTTRTLYATIKDNELVQVTSTSTDN